MRPARVRVLALVAVLAAVLSWVFLDAWERSGHEPLPTPWTAAAGLVVLAGVVLLAGLDVRRFLQGRKDRPLDPLVAARTAVFAQAAAYAGAVVTGWYAGVALVTVPDVVGERRARLILALASALAAVALSVAGLLAQRWCRLPPGEDDRDSDVPKGPQAPTP